MRRFIWVPTKYKIDYEVVVRSIEAVLNLKVAFIVIFAHLAIMHAR